MEGFEELIGQCKCLKKDCSLLVCPNKIYLDLKYRFGVESIVEGKVYEGAIVRQLDYSPNRKLCLKRLGMNGVPTPIFDPVLYHVYWRMYRNARWFNVDTAPWRVVAVDYHYVPVDTLGAFLLKKVGDKYFHVVELEVGPTYVKTVAGVDLFIHVDYGGGYNLVFAVSWFSRVSERADNVRVMLCYYWCYPNRQEVPELGREGCLRLYESLLEELKGGGVGGMELNAS